MRNNLAGAVLSTGFVVCCGVITGTCTTAILWTGVVNVRVGNMTMGELLMFWGSAGYLFSPIAGLTNLVGLYHRVRAVSDKVLRLLDEPNVLDDPKEPMPVPKTACAIRLENVTLRYDPQRPAAIDNISLTIPAGKRLCVMGPSGAGKTTLAKLIARLYDPTGGTIYFDDVDIRGFRVSDLRELVGFVSQEPIVFSGTIGDNIRYGNVAARMQAVVAAAQHAQIHEFINRLPERYRTLTHERGLTLSGGQKQRVNLARALLYDPVVLVLDDCTSALDAETEWKLVESFETALKNRTAVLVTHRVSIARGCDLVAMLDDGKLVEFGPPDDLLKNEGGAFAALYHEQVSKGGSMELVPANADLSGVQI
jgi:ABC-type bacteriocin/lantibiotic exporter with double-glycine peptidase domain